MVVSYHEEQPHRKPMEVHDEQNGITSFIDEEEQQEALIALVNHRCRQVKSLRDQVPPFPFLSFSFSFLVLCVTCYHLCSLIWYIMPNCYITYLV